MACIREYVTPEGLRVRIFDDCYINADPAEIRRRQATFNRTAYEMLKRKINGTQREEGTTRG